MLQGNFLYQQNEFILTAIALGLMLLAAELGFRRGRFMGPQLGDATRGEITTLQAALIGLLALLLAFTFELAVSRYNSRLELIVDESNAIGTMELRAQTLPDELKNDVLTSTRAYVSGRIKVFDYHASTAEKLAAENAVNDLQTRMWTIAATAARQNDRSVPIGLFESSLNQVFDSAAKRDAAMRNHVPESVLVLLFVASIFAMGSTGYASGLGGHRNTWAMITMSSVIALVILIIIDMDRPARGLIRVHERPMINLSASLANQPDADGTADFAARQNQPGRN
jgi:hypothetical protein